MKKMLALCMVLFCGVMAFAQTDSTGKDLTGKYKFPEGSVVNEVNVNYDNGALSMSSSAGTSELVKQSADVYTIVSFQGTAQFKRDSLSKKVTGVVIDAMGYHLEGTKDAEAATSFAPAMLHKEFLETERKQLAVR
jgi:hypothetical protein